MAGPIQIAQIQFITRSLRASLTRPANTTVYAAGDAVSDATGDAHLTFADAGQVAQLSGAISTAICRSSAQQGGTLFPDLELWLFRADFTDTADNAAWVPTDAELADCVGVVEFPVANWRAANATAGAGGNSLCVTTGINLTYKLSTTQLYGQLVMQNAYTPVSGEVFTVELAGVVD